MDDRKKKVTKSDGMYNTVSIVKNYLEENNIHLYEFLKNWDFNQQNKIKYRHLKDALSAKGYIGLDHNIKDIITDMAMKFILGGYNKKKGNLDEAYINYEGLCLEFV